MKKASERPWANYKGKHPSRALLAEWRNKATLLAQAAGFHSACELCKRPIKFDRRYGRLVLRGAQAWRARSIKRQICHNCYLVIKSTIEEMEILGQRDQLPPENYVAEEAKRRAKKGVKKDIEILQTPDRSE